MPANSMLKRRNPPQPLEPLFVIGNLHGCARQLDKMLEQAPSDVQRVFIGDYIDFGPQSERVLAKVEKECARGAIALMGNHERMLLDFLENPMQYGALWLRAGGDKTLSSFGITGVSALSSKPEFAFAADKLRRKMSNSSLRWFNKMAMQFDSGNIHIVHAAACPKTPMDAQSDQVRLWGDPEFFKKQRADHEWVVHGDKIEKKPSKRCGRINIDTGVQETGTLSAVLIEMDRQKFFTVTA